MSKRNVALSILLLLSTWGSGDAANHVAVQDLAVHKAPGYVEFTVTSTEPVHYTHFKLEGPRVVVDFHEAENRLAFDRREVGAAGVERVRAAFFSDETRDATRVVFDLSADVAYTVTNAGEGRVRIRFEAPAEPIAERPRPDLPEAPGAARDTAIEWQPPSALNSPPALAKTFPHDVPPAVPMVQDTRALAAVLEESLTDWGRDTGIVEPGVFEAPPPADPVLVANLEATAPAAAIQEPVLAPAPPVGALPAAGQAASLPLQSTAAAGAPPEPVTVPPAEPAPVTFLGQELAAIAQQYTGEIYSFDFRGVDLRDFFRTIADISGLNVILDPGVAGQVNLYLIDVPWDQALDVVFRTHGLGYELEGNVMRVATQATLQAEENALVALRETQELNAPQETRTYTLSYTQAAETATIITSVLSDRGNIITSTEHNALIITDITRYFDRVESLIQFLDQPQQQVEIEARLLSATKTFSRDLGNQLGIIINNNGSNVLTGIPGAPSPFQRTPPPSVTAGGDGGEGESGSSLPLISNFPVVGTAGLSYLVGIANDVLLDEVIQVAEARGTAKLLSRPRVTTQNNQLAHVEQGTQIPVQTSVNNTITVEYIPFSLSLDVTPRITEEGTILLTAEIENSTPDFARQVLGRPSVATQRASTQVLIPDGGTAVVGGILVDNDSVSVAQVPGLGSVPLLGHLFKSTSTVKNTSELLFFITARIKPANPLEFLNGAVDEEAFLVPELGGGGLEAILPEQRLLGAEQR